jgi:hypothetical protein
MLINTPDTAWIMAIATAATAAVTAVTAVIASSNRVNIIIKYFHTWINYMCYIMGCWIAFPQLRT